MVAALMLNGALSTRVWADGQHGNAHTGADSLIGVVRQTTERFKDVNVARAEGYAPMFGCVSGEDQRRDGHPHSSTWPWSATARLMRRSRRS
jgi:hypothetical protein